MLNKKTKIKSAKESQKSGSRQSSREPPVYSKIQTTQVCISADVNVVLS